MLSSGVCLCVRQAGVVSKRLAESSSFWHGGFLPLCYKEIRESPIFRAFPSGTLSQTSDLENFATASLSSCQRHSSSSTVELVDDTYTTVDEWWLFTSSRSTVTLSLYCGFVVQLVSTVDKILTDIAHRSGRASCKQLHDDHCGLWVGIKLWKML